MTPTGASPLGVVSTLAGVAVSVAIPILFLYLVRRLDMYGSSDRRAVGLSILWGAAAFGAAFAINTFALYRLLVPRAVLLVAVVPVVEELAKSGILIDRVRRPNFTYFVDGAILGFATGTGFAVLENLFYLSIAGPGDGLGLSVNRAFSASLMHGTACAIVGVALGRWRFERGRRRIGALAVGLAAAMSLHAAFNALTDPARGLAAPARVYGAIAVGLLGVVGVALMISAGLRAERAWLRAALAPDVGVTAAEADAVQHLRHVRTLLAPIEAHFGAARAADVADLLRLQARFGLKRQAAALAPDGPLRDALAADAAGLRAAMAERRRGIGLYVMAYVRAVWPGADDTLWARLDDAVAAAAPGGDNLWRTLARRADDV